ncbi:MAG: HAD-IIIA family hydrolase [Candidatus Omnitrophica bacterium]|nr:HAD-IIIA family hydrolase [Candidatus Omnitrophota bacterium]
MKIAFLDRDGVINKFPGNGKYVTKVKNFQFLPGSLEAIRMLTENGYTIFVVSNQAGVGKGIFTQRKLDQITEKMLREVQKKGGVIRQVYYSTARSDSDCEDRKPNIGSIRKAIKLLGKDMQIAHNAYFVGDTVTDMATGRNAGCKTIFVLSGRSDTGRLREKKIKPDFVAKNLLGAAQIMINGHPGIQRTALRKSSAVKKGA